jgi:hypothetical protein
MTKYFVDADGKYLGGFDGAVPPAGATEVPSPPDNAEFETWVGAQWVEDPARADIEADRDIDATFADNRTARLLFEINFDQENRLRALEGLAIVTKAQYRDALVAKLKTL